MSFKIFFYNWYFLCLELSFPQISGSSLMKSHCSHKYEKKTQSQWEILGLNHHSFNYFFKTEKKYICIYILYFNLKYFSLVIDFYSSIRLLKSQSSSQVFPGPLTWNGDPLPSSPPCFYTWSYTVFTVFEGVLKMISFILIF